MKLLRIALLAFPAALAAPLIAQEGGTSDMEILRQKLKADKKLLVAQNMELTEPEAKAFWPVYDAYQQDLQRINGRLRDVVLAYADTYRSGPVPDDTAKKLLQEALAIEEEEVKLKQSYVPKLQAVLPAAKVARYIQIENKVRAVMKYDLAANVPLVD